LFPIVGNHVRIVTGAFGDSKVFPKKNFSSPASGRIGMLRTIILGSCVSVQGTFERQLENGRILVRVGSRLFEGVPVIKKAA
jgi:hypothetical protein